MIIVIGVAKNLMLVGMFSCIVYFVLYSLEVYTDTINFPFHYTAVLYGVYLSYFGRHGFSDCCWLPELAFPVMYFGSSSCDIHCTSE